MIILHGIAASGTQQDRQGNSRRARHSRGATRPPHLIRQPVGEQRAEDAAHVGRHQVLQRLRDVGEALHRGRVARHLLARVRVPVGRPPVSAAPAPAPAATRRAAQNERREEQRRCSFVGSRVESRGRNFGKSKVVCIPYSGP